jgi:hypothetical protein
VRNGNQLLLNSSCNGYTQVGTKSMMAMPRISEQIHAGGGHSGQRSTTATTEAGDVFGGGMNDELVEPWLSGAEKGLRTNVQDPGFFLLFDCHRGILTTGLRSWQSAVRSACQ